MAVNVPGRDSPFHDETKALLGAILPAFAVVTLLCVVVVSLYRVPSESMAPTIHVGDCLTGDKLSCRFDVPEAGDV